MQTWRHKIVTLPGHVAWLLQKSIGGSRRRSSKRLSIADSKLSTAAKARASKSTMSKTSIKDKRPPSPTGSKTRISIAEKDVEAVGGAEKGVKSVKTVSSAEKDAKSVTGADS